MLATLLESRSRHQRNNRGTVVSIVLHSALILGAVYATASGSPNERRVDDERLHYVPTPPPVTRPPAASPVTTRRAAQLPRTIAVSVVVPTTIPPIDLSTQPVTPDAFVHIGASASSGDSGATSPSHDDRRAYTLSEVEVAVSLLRGAAPEYPQALRNSGIEGRVAAEYVVNESGRADPSSLHILSSTNELFVDAVRRALPQMRFTPARLGDKAVAQVVRQEFVFKLDR